MAVRDISHFENGCTDVWRFTINVGRSCNIIRFSRKEVSNVRENILFLSEVLTGVQGYPINLARMSRRIRPARFCVIKIKKTNGNWSFYSLGRRWRGKYSGQVILVIL